MVKKYGNAWRGRGGEREREREREKQLRKMNYVSEASQHAAVGLRHRFHCMLLTSYLLTSEK